MEAGGPSGKPVLQRPRRSAIRRRARRIAAGGLHEALKELHKVASDEDLMAAGLAIRCILEASEGRKRSMAALADAPVDDSCNREIEALEESFPEDLETPEMEGDGHP